MVVLKSSGNKRQRRAHGSGGGGWQRLAAAKNQWRHKKQPLKTTVVEGMKTFTNNGGQKRIRETKK